MSLFASIVKIGFSGISDSVNSSLIEIGKKDKTTRNLINQLVKDENALLEHLSVIIKQDPEFDEEPFRKVAEGLTARRALLVQMIEDQMRSIQTVYDDLDGKMAQFDACVKRMAPGVQGLGGDATDDSRKKKKRKAGNEASSLETEKQLFEQLIAGTVPDPSEPLYCFCRRISCGEMVGCDNEDCALEWFHYSCVGISLSQEVPETWYCPDCAPKVQGAA